MRASEGSLALILLFFLFSLFIVLYGCDKHGQLCDAHIIHFIDNDAHILVGEAVTNVRVCVHCLNSPAAHGFVFAREFIVLVLDLRKEIINVHITGNLIGVFTGLSELLDNDVGFIPYVADKLFQNVFHGNNAHSAAKFIHDDKQVCLMLAHDAERVGQAQGLMYQLGLDQKGFDIDLGHVAANLGQLLIEVVQYKNTDDIVNTVTVNGNTGN